MCTNDPMPKRTILMSPRSVMRVTALLLVPTAAPSAQFSMLSEIDISVSSDLTSVEIVGDHALVSHRANGIQSVVDLRDPSSPVLCPTSGFNAPFGDMFGEAHYYDGLGGHLLTGHRFGGLTMIDVSSPCNSLAPVSTVQTQYLHQGLTTWADGFTHYLFYGEHPAGGSAGGIRIYDITLGSLLQVGASLDPTGVELDGGDLVISPSGSWCFQYSPRGFSTGPDTALMVYDVFDKTNPQWVTSLDLPGKTVFSAAELVYSGTHESLFIAAGPDGLQLVDVSSPPNPTAVRLFPNFPNVMVQEVVFYNANILLIDAQIGTNAFLVALDVANPENPVVLGVQPVGGTISDLDVDRGLVFATVRKDGSQSRVLQTWM